MERDANYVAVGAFVLLVVALGIAFVLWYSDARDTSEVQQYEIYFGGTVNGLTEGSPVRYLGVDVGRVRQLSLDREMPGTVKAVVDVDTTAPVSGATRASLRLQNITGLLYVELRQEPGALESAALPRGDEFPVIESVTSDLDELIASLPEMVARVTVLTDRISLAFSEQNVSAMTEIVDNVRVTSRELPQVARSVAVLVPELHATISEIKGLASSLRGTTDEVSPDIRETIERFAEVANTLAETAMRLDGFISDSEGNVTRFTQQGLLQVEQLLREGRTAAREFRELSRVLKENPSQLIYEPQADGLEIAQ
jgi:phospholipid/cholesterol/gamma-HCH transport system substrate-binding protein